MKNIVSLEFETNYIRAAEIEKPDSSKPTLVRYSEVAVDPGVVGDSEVFDVNLASIALKKLWQTGGFSTKLVSLAVSNRRIIVRDYEAAYTDLDRIKATLTFETAELLPSQMENSILDFYPIEKVEHNGRPLARGLLVATAAEPMELLVNAIELAGLTVEFVDLSLFGLARAARNLLPTNEEYLIANVSSTSTDVLAMRNGCPQMIRIVPNGLSMRTRQEGAHRDDELPAHQMEAHKPAIKPVDSLVGALRSTLNFYEGRGGNVEKIYLTGEGALSPELPPKILSFLGVTAEPLALSSIINGPTKQEHRDPVVESALIALTATGLRSKK